MAEHNDSGCRELAECGPVLIRDFDQFARGDSPQQRD
jgi:hypothetical protein